MAHTERTLKLNENWDLTLNDSGSMALCGSAALAAAQNVANACRLFTKDAYFAQNMGIPHFSVELGHRMPSSVFAAYVRKAALSVPQVAEVQSVDIEGVDFETRALKGSVTFKPVGEEDYVTIDL